MVVGPGAWRACCLAPLVAAVCCHQIDVMSFLSVSAFYIFIYSSSFCISLYFFFATQTNTHWYTIIMTKQQRRKHSHTHARTQFSLIEHIWTFFNTRSEFALRRATVVAIQIYIENSLMQTPTPMPIHDALLSFDFVERDKLWRVERVSRNSINWVCAHANTFSQYFFFIFFASFQFIFFVYSQSNCLRDGRFSGETGIDSLFWYEIDAEMNFSKLSTSLGVVVRSPGNSFVAYSDGKKCDPERSVKGNRISPKFDLFLGTNNNNNSLWINA